MPADTSNSLVWSVRELVDGIAGSSTKFVVRVPTFQRSLVWSREQKETLIDSLLSGYPVGSLLLFQGKEKEAGKDVYSVVDGLQRSSTLRQYVERPLDYVSAAVLPMKEMDALANDLQIAREVLDARVTAWMRITKTFKLVDGYDSFELYEALTEGTEAPAAAFKALKPRLDAMLQQLEHDVRLDDVRIPIVVYSGEIERLPEIFERVNQRGTKLSKYEIFAAAWSKGAETQINNTAIRTAVAKKYEVLLDADYQIEGLDTSAPQSSFNLFEYLFGLGKLMIDRSPHLFGATDSGAEAEPAAFSAATLATGLQLSKMSDLKSAMTRDDQGLIDPQGLESALLESIDFIEGVLKPYVGLRLNRDKGATFVGHGELQIVSMIARALVGRYDPAHNFAERTNWQKDRKALHSFLPRHYLADVLDEVWRGPIYSLAYERVWAADGDQRPQAPSAYYATDVPRETFSRLLDAWFEKDLAKMQVKRPNIRKSSLVLLRFIYSDVVTFFQNAGTSFELEHLFPVSRLTSFVEADGVRDGWPISSIANLSLFEKDLNREKSSKTISEHLAVNPMSKAELAQLAKLMQSPIEDVLIPEAGLEYQDYVAFLESRWARLKASALRALKY